MNTSLSLILAYSLMTTSPLPYPTLRGPDATWGNLTHSRGIVVKNTPPAKLCDLALDACQGVISAQDASIANLKSNVATLEDRLAAQSSPLLPTWAWIAVSLATGLALGTVLTHRQ